MTLEYDDIFSYFLGNVSDYQIASLNTNDAYELMVEYLEKTVAQPYIRRLFSSVSLNTEIHTLEFEMSYVVEESADRDFVRSLLAKGMVCEWLRPQVRNKVNLSQMFAGKEQRFFSQSQHISELRAMLEDTDIEVRRLIRDRGYINNSYLEVQ